MIVNSSSRLMHSRISRAPGSESPGVPASVISAIFSPDSESFDQLGGAHRFIVLVITDQRFVDLVMLQQNSRVSRVLGRDKIDIFQNFERPQCDIAKISDGRGDDVKHGLGKIDLHRIATGTFLRNGARSIVHTKDNSDSPRSLRASAFSAVDPLFSTARDGLSSAAVR